LAQELFQHSKALVRRSSLLSFHKETMKGTAMSQIAFIFALSAYPAVGVVLRGTAPKANATKAIPSLPEAIAAKWDNMDMFVGEMFKAACTLQVANGKEKGNVQGIMKACGLITSTQGKKCRTDCAARWGEIANKREACDDKCVLIYKNFEKSCVEQGRNLVIKYDQKEKKRQAKMACRTGFCKEFPSVWMAQSEEAMNKSMNRSCNMLCTTNAVQQDCDQVWAATVSSKTLDIALACNENNSAGFKQCFKASTTGSSKKYAGCQKKTSKTCTSAFKNCTAKAGPNISKKGRRGGAEFCQERKKVCEKQSNAKCLSENNAGLAAGKANCTKQNHKAVSFCKTDSLNTTKTNDMSSCMGKKMPACQTGCHNKCKVYEMTKCLAQGKQGAAKFGADFCLDFWTLLHASSEIDQITGDPLQRGRGRSR